MSSSLTNPATLKALMQKYHLHPAKYLGQNFLIDKNAVKKLIAVADIKKSDTIIEVGAGVGTITIELAERAKKVIAVEKDRALIPILKENTKNFENVKLIQGDILQLQLSDYPLPVPPSPQASAGRSTRYSLLGNIPYYLTAPLLRKFLETANPPESMTLMVQKEMAQRICANPPDMSVLALSVQVYAEPKIIAIIPRSSFWPTPKVDSAIFRIARVTTDVNTDLHEFFTIAKAGFSSPRKQLANNLSKKLGLTAEGTKAWLKETGIDPARRAETLTVREWARLAASRPLAAQSE